MPEPKLVKLFDACHINPPSIEYSIDIPVALTVIVPLLEPQSVGFAEATVLIIGNSGFVKISSAAKTIHVPLIFLVRISYVPPTKPVNIIDG